MFGESILNPIRLSAQVREIGEDVYVETEQVLQKDAKKTATVDLTSRMDNFRSNTDAGKKR